MNPPETTHKATQELGPSVVNNLLVWTSASSITTADACLRKWYFEQVQQLRGPSTRAQDRGTALHAEIEAYLTEGKPLLSTLAIAGRVYIPMPDEGLRIEHSILGAIPAVNGVDIAGHVDLWNLTNVSIDDQARQVWEGHPTVETKDWKTTSSFEWAKTPAELAKNIQLITYAEAAFQVWPMKTHARLTHVYFRTRGMPDACLRTVLVDREHVARGWARNASIVRTMQDIAKEKTIDKVPGNRSSCHAYGGCPHMARCSLAQHDSLSELLGHRGAAALTSSLTPEQGLIPTMSLLDKLKKNTAAPVVDAKAALAAEVARLKAEEVARRVAVPPGFAENLRALEACGRGMPAFTGRATTAVAALKGGTCPAGSGWLGENIEAPIEDPLILADLLEEVQSLGPVEPAAPVVQPILPPDAPASKPELAALPVDTSVATEVPAPAAPKKRAAKKAADPVAVVDTKLAQVDPRFSPGYYDAPNEALVGRADARQAAMTENFNTNYGGGGFDATSNQAPLRVDLYVNCVPVGADYERLEAYADKLALAIAQQYSCRDIRTADKDSPLGYGKGLGVLAAVVREAPPKPGVYVVRSGDPIVDTVIAAMRVVVAASGGLLVEGI